MGRRESTPSLGTPECHLLFFLQVGKKCTLGSKPPEEERYISKGGERGRWVFGYLFKYMQFISVQGLPGGSEGKESACSAGDTGSILGSGRSPGEGHGNPLQYSCLENSMNRGAWRATVHGVASQQAGLHHIPSNVICIQASCEIILLMEYLRNQI